MQKDFHYYGTYCAAYLAGYSHEECLDICYSAQFVDCCSKTYLNMAGGPKSAATTQLQLELMDARTDVVGLQDITRIWASFHFLPKDLYAEREDIKASKKYMNKYRLICGSNGDLLVDTVELAKGKSLEAAGLAMHVLADTWAHMYFAGTPSLVINNTNYHFYELIFDGERYRDELIKFKHSTGDDDLESRIYINSLYQSSENSIMNLGHGRAGHLPDYSFMRYKYLPAWGDYEEVTKDNPSDYIHAFTQMIYAFKYLRGEIRRFEKDTYDMEAISQYENHIKEIIEKRQLDSCDDWRVFGENLSGQVIPEFDMDAYKNEYIDVQEGEKDKTRFGKFIIAALAQKSMVTNKIYKSGNKLAGFSIDYEEKGMKGIKDYAKLVEKEVEEIEEKIND